MNRTASPIHSWIVVIGVPIGGGTHWGIRTGRNQASSTRFGVTEELLTKHFNLYQTLHK